MGKAFGEWCGLVLGGAYRTDVQHVIFSQRYDLVRTERENGYGFTSSISGFANKTVRKHFVAFQIIYQGSDVALAQAIMR